MDTQERVRKMVSLEVLANVGSLVEKLISCDEDFYDDFENTWSIHCPECGDDDVELEPDAAADEDGDDVYFERRCNNCDHYFDSDEDVQEPVDIFEYYLVSGWLLRKLDSRGEAVHLDFNIWGRSCTGQAVYLDPVMTSIARDAGMLEDNDDQE